MNFWIIAVLMLLGASAFIVLPLQRKKLGPLLAGGVLVYLVSLTMGSYLLFTNNDPDHIGQVASPAGEASVGSVEQMVASLEQRLATEEGSATDWSMLGRSYVFMNRFQDAVQAYGRANEISGGNDPGIMIAYAEVLAVTDPKSLKTDGAELLNRALRMTPMNPQGLWWGGVSAMELGDEDLARERWERLLELEDLPEALVKVVRQQLAILSGEAGVANDVAGASGGGSTSGSDVAVPMRVTIDESLAAQLDPATKLFVFARAVDSGGPPLAVSQHTAADLPLEVTLGQHNVMLPGTRLSDYKNMKLVARLARSGTPVAQSGDLFGEADYEAGQDDRVIVVIDQVVE